MDNNFYKDKRKNSKKQEKGNYFSKVLLVQLILSLIITGMLFAICSTQTSLSDNIRNIYSDICQQDFAVSKIFDNVKNVVKQTFAPGSVTEDEINNTSENTAGEEDTFSPVLALVHTNGI